MQTQPTQPRTADLHTVPVLDRCHGSSAVYVTRILGTYSTGRPADTVGVHAHDVTECRLSKPRRLTRDDGSEFWTRTLRVTTADGQVLTLSLYGDTREELAFIWGEAMNG